MKTQRKVFANAIILTELGFVQRNPEKKPWLFSKTVHRRANVILYADLGGSDVIPIYKDTAALLYTSVKLRGDDPKINAYIIRKFGERLQKEGAQVRTSFYEGLIFESIDVDPVTHVSSRILGSLLKPVYT